MTRSLHTTALAVPMFLFGISLASAQPSGSINVQVPAQWGSDVEKQVNATGSVALDHGFASGRGTLFFDSALDRFAGTDPWQTWLHNAGVIGAFPIGKTRLEAGGSAFLRANTGPWADAGFAGLSGVALVERAWDALTLTGAYGAYVRRFGDLSALNQFEHQASLRAHANLPSRTTLIGAVALGGKTYEGSPAAVETALPVDVGPRGIGRRGQLIPGRSVATLIGDAVNVGSARTQWSWTARVAQSLADRTGVWIEREERRTDGDPPPAVVWTPPLFYEDGVYDDPYAIDARTWRAGVKHAFPRGDELVFWASRSQRDFAGLVVDEASSLLREDTLLRAGIEARVPLTAGTRRIGVDLNGGYGYAWNRSSELLERYRAHALWVGFELAF